MRLWFLAAFLLLLIWGNSLLPAPYSQQSSEWLARLLAPAGTGTEQINYLLRKSAHVFEFFTLSLVLSLLRSRLRKPWSLLILSGILVALIDETLQLFVAGRSGLISDVWLDLFGFLLGSTAFFVFSHLKHLREENR